MVMLDPEKVEKLIEFLKSQGASKISIFGSYARNDHSPESDLDIMVDFSDRKSLIDLIGMEQELSDMIGIKVDLLTERSISPYILDEIRKDIAVVYG